MEQQQEVHPEVALTYAQPDPQTPTSISSAGSAELSDSLTTPVSKSTTHVSPQVLFFPPKKMPRRNIAAGMCCYEYAKDYEEDDADTNPYVVDDEEFGQVAVPFVSQLEDTAECIVAESPLETDTSTRTVATYGESYITFVSQLEDTAESIVAESPQETDTSTRTVATLVDTSISSAGSADLPDSLTTPVSKSTTHITPALAADLKDSLTTPVSKSTTHITPALAARPPPLAVIRPIFSPRLLKAFSSQKELTYEIKYAQSELVVKRSQVEVDGHFTAQGLYRGWGLFTPAQHRGRGMCQRVCACVCTSADVRAQCVGTVNVTKRHTECVYSSRKCHHTPHRRARIQG